MSKKFSSEGNGQGKPRTDPSVGTVNWTSNRGGLHSRLDIGHGIDKKVSPISKKITSVKKCDLIEMAM